MMEARNGKVSSQWWMFETQRNTYKNRSPWLQSTLAELDKKTHAMLRIIEGDADSFAQRAEMFYKKRPELIGMVQDFYRAHRLLAEGYDQVKSESGTRLLTPWALSSTNFKYQPDKSVSLSNDKAYDSYSETFDLEESDLSEVEDPEPETQATTDADSDDISTDIDNGEVEKLKREIERLREENRVQKEALLQKDEEKRAVIRELSSAMDFLKEENKSLRKIISSNIGKESRDPPKFKVSKDGFWKRLFGGPPQAEVSLVTF